MSVIFSLMLLLTAPYDAQLLITEGEAAGCLNGDFNIIYYKEAKAHADYMARNCRQSHDGFSSRANRLGGKCAEACSESWRGQSLEEAARDAFFVSWPASPGHWKIAVTPCKYYGIAASRGKNNIIYTCCIVGYQ